MKLFDVKCCVCYTFIGQQMSNSMYFKFDAVRGIGDDHSVRF